MQQEVLPEVRDKDDKRIALVGKEMLSCQEAMEQGRVGKGPAQAAGVVLAEVDSERGHRPEPAKGRAEGKAVAWAVVVKAEVAAEGVAKRAAAKQELRMTEEKEAAMPRGDGTGPMGMGPMTGRAAGFCAGFGMPGFANPIPGRGFGMGFGRGRGGGFGGGGGGRGGRGWRNMYYATGMTGMQRAAVGWPAFGGGFAGAPAAPAMTKEQQVEALKEQARFLGEQLEAVKEHIEELSAPEGAK